MISIPLSRYREFKYDRSKGTRWGQQFYEYMELQKITSHIAKVWCDKLYEQTSNTGRKMVLAVIDHNN